MLLRRDAKTSLALDQVQRGLITELCHLTKQTESGHPKWMFGGEGDDQ